MWKRRIELTVTDSTTGATLLSTSENRIDFVYDGRLDWVADTLKIEVYNLSPDTLKMLLNTQQRDVLIKVGYEDEGVTTLLDGYVVNVHGRKAMPNHITALWCVPHTTKNLSKYGTTVIHYPSRTLRDLIKLVSFTGSYKSDPVFYGMSEEVLNTRIPTYTLPNNVNEALVDLGNQYGFYARGTNSNLRIIAKLDSPSVIQQMFANGAKEHRLTLEKLKGTPEASVAMIDLTINLNTNIACGDIIDVSEFLSHESTDPNQPASEGVLNINDAGSVMFYDQDIKNYIVYEKYLVLGVQYVGSNYNPCWETRINGVQFNDGIAGDPNVAANGRGGGTGVSQVDVPHELAKGRSGSSANVTASTGLSKKEIDDLNQVKLSPEQNTAIDAVSKGDVKKANFLRHKLIIENRGNDQVSNAVSGKGAVGPYQIMENTGKNLGLTINNQQDDRTDFGKSTAAVGKLYDQLYKQYDGNVHAMNAAYNGGQKSGNAVMAGKEAPALETRNYNKYDDALSAGEV